MELLTEEIIETYTRMKCTEQHVVLAEAAEYSVQYILGMSFDELRKNGAIPTTINYACILILDDLIEFSRPNEYSQMVPPMSCFQLPKILNLLLEPYAKPGICRRTAEMEDMLRNGKAPKGSKYPHIETEIPTKDLIRMYEDDHKRRMDDIKIAIKMEKDREERDRKERKWLGIIYAILIIILIILIAL